MTKLEMLFIRACKSQNPRKRLKSVHQRFYLTQGETTQMLCIANVLINLCENYAPIKPMKLLSDMAPAHSWAFDLDENANYWERVIAVLSSHIGLTEKDKFPDLIPPLQFRKAG